MLLERLGPGRLVDLTDAVTAIQAFSEAAESTHTRVRAWVQARSARLVARGISDDHCLHRWLAETLVPPAPL